MDTITLETRTLRLSGAHHTTVLEHCPPAVQRMVLRRWRGGDSGITWNTILRWIEETPGLARPSAATERFGRYIPGGAYAHSVSEGVLSWPEPRRAARMTVPAFFEMKGDIA